MNKSIRLLIMLTVALSGTSAFAERALVAENQKKTVTSLCTADEDVVFECVTPKKKNASLCASKDVSVNEGYLVYRFGRIGEKPELVYPKPGVKPSKAFTYDSYSYIRGRGHQVAFSVGAYTYTLYDDFHSIGEWGSGIIVQKSGKQIMHIVCKEYDEKGQGLLGFVENIGLPESKGLAEWPERNNNVPPWPWPQIDSEDEEYKPDQELIRK